jgi:hypothetical protein
LKIKLPLLHPLQATERANLGRCPGARKIDIKGTEKEQIERAEEGIKILIRNERKKGNSFARGGGGRHG